MLPISLTIKGLYSYQEEQTIDFRRLTDSGIFGIFGNVGSGKSSILEAITFALFGETERMNIRDNRAYNMLNLKSDHLLIKFVFADSFQNVSYQIIVKGKRSRRQFEKVETFTRDAYRITDSQPIPIDITTIPEIIGLTYENFRRTIIIPQGQFQEFLQLNAKDRGEMMKQLFNLDRFELFENVKTVEQRTIEQIRYMDGQLSQIGNVRVEDIETKQQELVANQTALETLQVQKTVKQKAETEFSALQKLFQDIDRQRELVEKLKNRQTYYADLERSLNEYEQCRLNFETLLADRTEILKQIRSSEIEIHQNEGEQLLTEQKLGIEKAKLEKLKQEYDTKDLLQQKAKEFQTILKISEQESQQAIYEKKFNKLQHALTEMKSKRSEITEQKEKLALELATLKSSLQDVGILTEIKNWFDRNNVLENELQKQYAEIEQLEADQAELSRNQDRVYADIAAQIDAPIASDQPLTDVTSLLQQAIDNLDIQLKAVETEIEQITLQNKLQEFVSHIEEGKPCPLCGSQQHPNILNAKNVKAELREAKQKKVQAEKKKEIIRKLVENCHELAIRQRTLQEQVNKARFRFSECRQSVETHRSLFQWDAFRKADEKAISQKIVEYRNQEKRIRQLETQIEAAAKALEETNQLKERYENQLNEMIRDMTECHTILGTLKSQIRLLNRDVEKVKDRTEIEKTIQNLRIEYDTIGDRFNKQNERVSQLQTQLGNLNGKLETQHHHLMGLQQKSKEIEVRLAERLQESPYRQLDQVKAVLANPMDRNKIRFEIEQFGKTLHAAETRLEDLRSKAEGKSYNREEHERLKAEIRRIEERITASTKECGRLQAVIEKMQKDLAERSRLTVELEGLKNRAANINILKSLFQANGFVNYVSTGFLQNLCCAANDRFFRLTGQTLRLELNEKNNFEVRDFMNEGKLRSIKTLSGGQTFQAALSLALALSDNIQKSSSSRHSFFFIDEGFGTLDKESLQIVFNTLKLLRKENRIVGIISHLDDMQQEIDCYLKIENNGHTGSRIQSSWK